jgi:hypothetical protein
MGMSFPFGCMLGFVFLSIAFELGIGYFIHHAFVFFNDISFVSKSTRQIL